jgi:uncharacterized membrane protein YoaK (UPF0700 family)
MVTDIGIGLANVLGQDPATDRTKLRLHLLTVGAFLGGGIFGALLYRCIGTTLLRIVALLLALLAAPGIRTAGR